jgi:hypothetical protein
MSLRKRRSEQACFQGESRRPGIADTSTLSKEDAENFMGGRFIVREAEWGIVARCHSVVLYLDVPNHVFF